VVVAAVLLLAGAAAAAVVLVVTEDGSESVPPLGTRGLSAASFVEPQQLLFGDAVTAGVEVVVDRRRHDPEAVTVRWHFEPYQPVAPVRTEREDAGGLTRLRFTTRLRCLREECLFATIRRASAFRPAAVLAEGERVADVEWPSVAVASRFAQSRPESGPVPTGLWRVNAADLPAPTYRVPPQVAFVVLAVLAGLLVALGVLCIVRAVRPAPAGPPPLPPLEQALVLLQAARRTAEPQEERKALDLLSVELSRHGRSDLAEEASELAWGRLRPGSHATDRLAERVGELVASRNGRA
jgi:hypothetical protein